MLIFVTQPNNVVLEVEVDAKACGQECLDQVCQQLGIIEADYFGLQYAGSKGEQLWLNMRNQITRQVSGQRPYRLRLRVKFFVQPHLLLQEVTRQQFYLQLKQEFVSTKMTMLTEAQSIDIAAYIAQVEHRDFQPDAAVSATYVSVVPSIYSDNPDILMRVTEKHSELQGLTRESAQYRMLQQVASVDSYGVEYHQVRNSAGLSFHMGIGPEGISLYDMDWKIVKSITYPTVQMATHAGKCLFLHTIRDDGSSVIVGFKLVSQKAANGLYRCVTEMHSFYRCDTVRNAVASQFSRDLKGTLASLFNENTSLGKKYVFDIRRTCREAYDHARRVLYVKGNSVSLPSTPVNKPSLCQNDHHHESDLCNAKECQVLKERLERIQDAMLCRVCMDSDIDTAFCPCGHIVCCANCAGRLQCCPLCRSEISQVQHVFLPTPLTVETT